MMKKLAFCDEATKEAARIAFHAGWQACIDGADLQHVWMLFKVMKRTASDSASAASFRA
jgi:hypothetical protein